MDPRPTPLEPSSARTRDPFIDAVRAFAILRVVAWHTLSWPALSYIAAMPVMFFVSGTLAQSSFAGRDARNVLHGRLRRLLPPLWLYGAVAWAVFAATGATPADAAHHLLWWVVPLWDPTGPSSAVAWWAPLWYLRAYLWLLLLTPLLRRVVQTVGRTTTVVSATSLAVTVAIAVTAGATVVTPLRDLALYGLFWTLGMVRTERRDRGTSGKSALASPVAALVATVALAGSAIAWMVIRPAPLGIVNASPIAELLLGAAWIIGLSAVAPLIRRAAASGLPQRGIAALNRRAMTIYLWHCGAIALSHRALMALHVHGGARWAALSLLVGLTTTAFVYLAGPLEDATARRHVRVPASATRRRVAVRAFVGAAAVPCVLAAAMVVPGTDAEDAQGAYVPASGRGLERLIHASRPSSAVPVEHVAPTGPVEATELDNLLSSWRDQWHITGVITALARSDGSNVARAAGIDALTDQPMLANQRIPAHSITKSFTGALVAQLAAEGLLDLDAPLAAVVPEFAHADAITLRQLAQHTSGVIDTGASPEVALALAGSVPLLFAPGSNTNYSDSAYYLLATAAERVTGQPYGELVQQRFLAPLGLGDTAVVNDARWSAGGIESTASDLARWATAFWGGEFGPDVTTQVRGLDPSNNFGIGTFGYCPCLVADGTYEAEMYGHLSAQGRLARDPGDDLAVMIHTNEENDGARTIDAWTDLDWRIRETVRNRPLPTPPPIPEADIADPTDVVSAAPVGS